MRKILIAALVLITASVTWAASDDVFSLRGNSPLNADSMDVMDKKWRDGEGTVVRSYPQQPPLVPHTTEDYAITKDNNDCLMCHNWKSELPGATKIGVSHFVNRNGQALSSISPRRYFCNQCHVPQRDVEPLVLNVD
ncbi:MAG TPA: nitrate reductase cytochrome c-type subunit [Gammaproteobacteria bacterium]|nr:nitrate reductase cytochrome c-type subunit [Gammaproteobacteria bacterium]